jgi:signal transduction histidine kinase/CheY-like chemotaxis protein
MRLSLRLRERLARIGFGQPLWVGLSAAFLIVAGALTAVEGVLGLARSAAEAALRSHLEQVAELLASMVDPALHRQLDDPSETDSPLYEEAIRRLRNAHQSTRDLVFVYTLVDDGGTARFVLDTAEPGDRDGDGVEDRSGVWEAYEDMDPVAERVLDEGVTQATEHPYSDAWGTFMSAYAPLLDEQGRVCGILGVDQDAREFKAAIEQQVRAARHGLTLAALIALGVGLAVMGLRRSERRLLAELVAARKAAEAAARAKSEFLANMSHELRTPLTAILGYSEMLRQDGDLARAPEDRLRSLLAIQTSGQHLLTLINDVLDLSKIEAGAMGIEELPTDLGELLAGLEAMLGPRASERGLELRVELATPLARRVITDPTRLRQVLINLVGNALKFTERGSVRLAAGLSQDGQRLRFEVEDTGRGLSLEQANRLFAPFTQADNSVGRTHGGTGLGLAISRRLGRMLGGEVSLLRSAPGQGSTFLVELPYRPLPDSPPLAGLEHVAPARPTQRPQEQLRGRLLLVEDNPVNRRLFKALLTQAGLTVVEAEHGQRALELVAEQPGFDLILTDLQMPVLDGYSLIERLRAEGHRTPLVALTANALAEEQERCRQLGCDDFLTKPIQAAALLACCRRWLEPRPAEKVA